jgi:hypothetical protein
MSARLQQSEHLAHTENGRWSDLDSGSDAVCRQELRQTRPSDDAGSAIGSSVQTVTLRSLWGVAQRQRRRRGGDDLSQRHPVAFRRKAGEGARDEDSGAPESRP